MSLNHNSCFLRGVQAHGLKSSANLSVISELHKKKPARGKKTLVPAPDMLAAKPLECEVYTCTYYIVGTGKRILHSY